jgi:hypothetical protein
MGNVSKLFADAPRREPMIGRASAAREYWPMARVADMDLLMMRMARVNVLLTGPDALVQNVLDVLLPDLAMPLRTWRPAEQLELPRAGQRGTMILRHVGGLTPDDQVRLLEWLDMTAGRIQVISTTSSPLLPRAETGAFLHTLYYRLNTIYVDVTT